MGRKTRKGKPSSRISAAKADEMLRNPPRGKALTERQRRMLYAAANKGR